MSAKIYPQKSTNWARLLTLGVATVVIMAGVAFGANFLWQKQFGPTTASAADCTLAQQLIDEAQTPPADNAEADKWEKNIRQVRYTQFQDEGISTEVGRYVSWARVKATGEGAQPTAEQFKEMKDKAIGHCDDSGVELKIPAIAF